MPPDGPAAYTLMVAGRRTGKTSFLRLLLDSSNVASTVSRDQLASVAKFVQGSSAHTPHVRSVSLDIDLAPDDLDAEHPLALTLIDTPSLNPEDDPDCQRTLQEILRHVERRLGDGLDSDRQTLASDPLVHLCIYFLDPDFIVPPPVPAPPISIVPRARTNSLSTHEHDPVILEPSVANPMLSRPILPQADIAAIRRLSARVNVLPVVARADTLTLDRLTAVKMAVRRDLAEAGIGFGIFDLDIPLYAQLESTVARAKSEHGYMKHMNGSPSGSTPATPTLRLPFALISPDMYSHSDGVARAPLSRHELAQLYVPSKHLVNQNQAPPKIMPGKFLRVYRWGSLDVMDASHSEFLHLRGAVLHHMETLQKYTREYLLEKFRAEVQPVSPPHARQPVAVATRLPPMRATRPTLAIDTAPPHANGNGHIPLQHQQQQQQQQQQPQPQHQQRSAMVDEPMSAHVLSAAGLHDLSPKTSTSSRSQRQRTKKIPVACNFCRSRKLRCDGGRPACGQCFKRSNPCDYTASSKRRSTGKPRKQYGSESEGDSVEDEQGMFDHPSHSPSLASSAPHSRRSSNVGMLLTDALPPLNPAPDPRDAPPAVLPPINGSMAYGPAGARRPSLGTELPPIATLAPPPGPSDDGMSLASLDTSEGSGPRRRTSSASSSMVSGRGSRGGGSKIVACNFCRARKTRCDGAHPTCGSCHRRNVQCNYVNDAAAKARSRSSGSGGTPPDISASNSSRSSPVSVSIGTPSLPDASNSLMRRLGALDPDMLPNPAKKMRLEMSAPSIAVLNGA
ncbi:uncharacterized protein BXZ73DRAFT_51157 [Epithele typhae]|uniref:uncharacterized protein n=1 Tax=Epithele typhae TaxID=378194 RepID=UPI00200778D4|nr:uncharacterized protein BXZ73DRAFT_51157 [Epithele typhae]KAH9922836.1 hypothetical protein BXZ73DRAFT_51157 [Epithele typhae]